MHGVTLRLCRLFGIAGLLAVLATPLYASTTAAEAAANAAAQHEMDTSPPDGNLPSFALRPEALAKAQHLQQVRNMLHFSGVVWGAVQLLLLLSLGIVARYCRWSVERFGNRWLQGYSFVFLLLLTTALLDLPLGVYGHALSLRYGLSVQRWPGWLGDQAKGLLLNWAIGGLLVMLLFFLIRKFPRRWWFVFWCASLPIMVFGIFVTPYVIDPLFNTFEPLAKTNPALVERLQGVALRGHMAIPPERMFLMKASEKVTTMNAYVTGFGSSKRVVVWDTSLKNGTPDEVLAIFAHESGHYVLNHIVKGMAAASLIILIFLFVGYHAVQWMLRRFGPAWDIPSQTNWGALAVLMLALTAFSALAEPLENALSRVEEHAADVYGQEAVHGLVADPKEAMRGAFQVLGESSFVVPNEPQWIEFWTGSHPALGRRAAFAAHYDPWVSGAEPRYFKR